MNRTRNGLGWVVGIALVLAVVAAETPEQAADGLRAIAVRAERRDQPTG